MTFASLVDSILAIMQPLGAIIIGLIMLVFIWGLAMFIRNSGDAEAHKKGRDFMVWSIIGLFVAVSVWGIVIAVRGTFFDSSDLNEDVDTTSLFN